MESSQPPARLCLCLLLASCGFPLRQAAIERPHHGVEPLPGFEDVRAVDGYPNASFQRSFDEAIAKFAQTPVPSDGRRNFDMLVLSSGGINGAFGAGLLTAWTQRGDRPEFRAVTGVSVGALMAPFVFAGPEFDGRLEELFRYIEPEDMHKEKGLITSVIWDESLMDNAPLEKSIARGVDMQLLNAVADRHAEGRRCFVGSTNLDMGHFVVWDLGAIASRRNETALKLFRKVLKASASIPVVYPPTRFRHGPVDELHADGAVIRPMFMPQNLFDGYLAAERAGLDWDEVDASMFVVHNGSLLPRPVTVARDTLAIALRTVTMMSYTMVAEDVLHLYMLCRAWGAKFHFMTLPDGQELSIEKFSAKDTDKLFLLGKGLIESRRAWSDSPPGYVIPGDLTKRIVPNTKASPADAEIKKRMQRVEFHLQEIQKLMMRQR